MIKEEKAMQVLDMFLHKQCDLERTRFAYDANEVWEAVKIARDTLEKQKHEEMTLEEALMVIESIPEKIWEQLSLSEYKAIMLVIGRAEMQIPKKPIYKDYNDNGYGEIIPNKALCPACGYEFEFGTWNEDDNHHCKCGQKIDWNKDNE